jgi:carboxymethylenebutenolidase
MMQQLIGICGSVGAAAALLASCSNDSTTSTSAATTAPTTTSTAAAPTSTAVATTPPSAAASTSTAVSAPPTTAKVGPALSVAADDPAVTATDVTFDGAAGQLLGYIARRSGATAKMPGIIVIHEIFGLTDHIRDVARRFATIGFVALCIDLTSRAGGTAKSQPSGALGQLAPSDAINDIAAALAFLTTQKDFSGKAGVTGFCYGGGMTLRSAANVPGLSAAVAYYGPTPDPADQMKNATIPVLAHYGANDARVNAGIASLESNIGGTFKKIVHDGAGHGFNNDTGGGYNEAVAVAAWKETNDWFSTYLA